MNGRLRASFEYGTALLLLAFAWWYASGPMGMPHYLLPSPQSVIATLWNLLQDGQLLPHVAFTVQNIVLGLAVGTVLGVALAYLLFKIPGLGEVLEGPLVVLQTAPKIALAPLIIIWFGLGLTAKIVLIVSLVFFPVFAGALFPPGAGAQENNVPQRLVLEGPYRYVRNPLYDTDFALILGADSLADLDGWHEPAQLCAEVGRRVATPAEAAELMGVRA